MSLITEYLNSQTKKMVVTKEIEQYLLDILGQDGYWRQEEGYFSFVEHIEKLVDLGELTPVKASAFNGRQPPLYEKYRIIMRGDTLDQSIRKKLLTGYHPQINTAYYLTHGQDYQEDEPYLVKLNIFLQRYKDFATWPMLTANERSFQIFRNEKWLLSKHGHLFCQRTGLTLATLRCYQTTEPFFYYSLNIPEGTKKIKVLIVENKDTFFSLKELFQQSINTWSGHKFSLLIYGEGRKIQKSLRFFTELQEYQQCHADFYYFGDLDPEGIRIWSDLQKEYRVPIKPFTLFYQVLWEKYGEDAPSLKEGKKTGQRFSAEALEKFLPYFAQPLATEIGQMLREEKYLPQEGLNAVLFREIAEKREEEGSA